MRKVIPGQIYKHFKGHLYVVLNIALHTETGEKLVIYYDLIDSSKIYARPYDMFISEVDKNKYPDVEQEFKFELNNNWKHPYEGEFIQSRGCGAVTSDLYGNIKFVDV